MVKAEWTEGEKAAMQARAAELRAEKAAAAKADPAGALKTAIAEMPGPDRVLAETIAEIVAEVAPQLQPRTWYGMPAWTTPGKDGRVVVFFKPGVKFNARTATLGFEDAAQLDDGNLWATSFSVTEIGPSERRTIADLVRKAAG